MELLVSWGSEHGNPVILSGARWSHGDELSHRYEDGQGADSDEEVPVIQASGPTVG